MSAPSSADLVGSRACAHAVGSSAADSIVTAPAVAQATLVSASSEAAARSNPCPPRRANAFGAGLDNRRIDRCGCARGADHAYQRLIEAATHVQIARDDVERTLAAVGADTAPPF